MLLQSRCEDRCDTQRLIICVSVSCFVDMNLIPFSRFLIRVNGCDVPICNRVLLTSLSKTSPCVQQARLSTVILNPCRPSLCSNSRLLVQQQRFKKKKVAETASNVPSDDEDDADEDKDDEIVGVGFKDHLVTCASLRFDVVAKSGFNLGRSKFEEAVMDGRIRWNGYKPTLKKSEWVSITDEIDLIKGRNFENNNFLDVTRLEILDIPGHRGHFGKV